MASGVLRALFGATALVLFIGFLFVEIVRSGATTTTATRTRGSFKELKVIGRDGPDLHPGSDPNYTSKRRVPNGPDPIHNRYKQLYSFNSNVYFFFSSVYWVLKSI